MSRHRCGNLAPAGERITLLSFRGGLRSDRCTILNIIFLVYIPVDLVRQLVLVDGEGTCDNHLLGGHRSRDLTPAGESITLLCGSCLRSDRTAIGHVILLIYHVIYFIRQFICIDVISTCNSHILGRHRSGNLTPARESIALLSWWCGLWSDWITNR